MGTRGMRWVRGDMRWVRGVRGRYEGYEVGTWGMRRVRGVRGGYKGYEVGTRWV